MSTNIVNNYLLEKYPYSNKVIGIKTKSYIESRKKDIFDNTLYFNNNCLLKNNNTLENYPSNKVIGIKTKSYIENHKKDIIDTTYLACCEYEEEMSKCEKIIEHFKQNKKKYQMLVVLVALMIPSSTLQAYALTTSTSSFTLKVYSMGKDIGKIICAIGVIAESSKCVLTGSVDQLGKIGVKYLAFGLLIRYLEDIVGWVFN